MRVTAKIKAQTRDRLLASARRLFEKNGFEQATTREISHACGIAAGTLFNYFPNKESLGLAIISQAVAEARQEFDQGLRGDESLAELLFAHIAVGLRYLRPCRRYVLSVLESTLSPLSGGGGCPEAQGFRSSHLDTVRLMLRQGGSTDEPSVVSLHLYWTLYLGVLAFWSRDDSPHQEHTLALLDQSTRLFVASLSHHGTGDKSWGWSLAN